MRSASSTLYGSALPLSLVLTVAAAGMMMRFCACSSVVGSDRTLVRVLALALALVRVGIIMLVLVIVVFLFLSLS